MTDHEEQNGTRKVIRMSDKKSTVMIIAIILLIMIIAALGVFMVLKKSPFSNVLAQYQKSSPDTLLSIQKATGENASTLANQIKSFCKDFDLKEFYLAQMDSASAKKSEVLIINPSSGKIECTIDRSANIQTNQTTLNQNVLATINGEPVYMNEVMSVYNNIPEAQRTNDSLQLSLDQVIATKLLLQDALSKGFNVSSEEVDSAINTFLTNNGLTLQQLEQGLTSSGSTMADYRMNVANNLLIQKEIGQITANVNIPLDAQMKAYYEANKQTFMTAAKATTRQLLLYSNATDDVQKMQEIQNIASLLNATNFCELVTKYSQDSVSVPRCGLYEFEQGQLLPEYEQVVFSSEPGSAKIVKTSVGYHIVIIENVTLPKQITYDEAREQVFNYLLLQEKQAAIDSYVAQLRQAAKVLSYID